MGVATGGSTSTSPLVPTGPATAHPTITHTTLARTVAPGPTTPLQAAAQAAANSQSSLNQYLNYLRTQMGRTNPNAASRTAGAELNAEVSPLLNQLNGQQQQGQAAINGYTKQFANQLGQIAPQVSAAYGQAEGTQQALDASLAQELSGNGTSQANDLAAQLQARGQSTAPATEAAQQAQGYAGASYATGSASLSQLLAQGAAANTYAKSLPGIAALSGLQATKGLQADVASQRSKIIADAQKQYPGLVNQLLGQQLATEKDTAAGLYNAAGLAGKNAKTAGATYLASVAQGLKTPKVFGGASSGYFTIDPKTGAAVPLTNPVTKPVAPKIFGSDKSGYFQEDPTTGKVVQITNGVATPTKYVVAGSDKAGRYLIDPTTGARIAQVTAPVKVKAGTATGGQTVNSFATAAHELTSAVNQWGQGKGRYVTDSSGTKTWQYDPNGSPVPYRQAVQQAIQSGPNTPAWRQHAIQTVNANSNYQPGENGRAYETIQQALPNIQEQVAALIAKGSPARDAYKAALATGVFPAKLRKPLLVAINELYTQDYFKKNPNATSTPADLLVRG